jgi:hypothetical protein
MRFFACIAAVPAVVLLALTGCDQPTAPAPEAPGVLQGQITDRTFLPANGATLTAEYCNHGLYCNDKLRLILDVQLNQDMPVALTATFYADSQRCAVAGSNGGPVRANTEAIFTIDLIHFDPDGTFLCPLPQRTTKMVVELWQTQPNQTSRTFPRAGAQPLLTREFAHGYTFVPE